MDMDQMSFSGIDLSICRHRVTETWKVLTQTQTHMFQYDMIFVWISLGSFIHILRYMNWVNIPTSQAKLVFFGWAIFSSITWETVLGPCTNVHMKVLAVKHFFEKKNNFWRCGAVHIFRSTLP